MSQSRPLTRHPSKGRQTPAQPAQFCGSFSIISALMLALMLAAPPVIAVESPPLFELMWGSGVDTGEAGAEVCSEETKPCFAGIAGSGEGEFNRTSGVAVSDAGLIYVAEWFGHRIQVFDSEGNFQWSWATQGNGEAADIEINDGKVYVVEHNLHRVLVYDTTGVFLWSFGGYGTDDGQFIYPVGVAIDSSGNIYVADRNNHRVQKFYADGTFLDKWGSSGTGDGQFLSPQDVDISATDEVYVTEEGNQRIQVFDTSGNYLRKWGEPGSDDGQFNAPVGMAFDANGDVYVAEAQNHRIQAFDTNGNYLFKWGASGSGDGQFYIPVWLAFGLSGELYVTEHFNHRVQKFVFPQPVYSCVGFEAPVGSEPITVRKKRAIPLKAQLLDQDGMPVTSDNIDAPPVVQILFSAQSGGDPVDATGDALAVGLGTEGNQFVFEDERWRYNLKTTLFTAPGTYKIYMVSGDQYHIAPTCEGTFVINE